MPASILFQSSVRSRPAAGGDAGSVARRLARRSTERCRVEPDYLGAQEPAAATNRKPRNFSRSSARRSAIGFAGSVWMNKEVYRDCQSTEWRMAAPEAADLDLRVEGPDARGLTDADIRRLFPGRSTGERLNRLRNWPRVVVRLTTCRWESRPTRRPRSRHRFRTSPWRSLLRSTGASGSGRPQVLDALLEAIEIASLAGDAAVWC